MSTTERGFLVIADISGYTSFLRNSELDSAAEHLRAFLDILIEQTRPPLVISRLQGDAVISYALEGSFLQGQTLVEIVERTYIAFRQALDLAVVNNACDCKACLLIPSLDLKFFVHHGEFRLQRLGSYIELVGSDVNLVHRLTKNTIVEKSGIKAYVAYTQAAVDALGIQQQARHMMPHEEEYEHIGPVTIYIQDMHTVWEQRQSQSRNIVTPEDALLAIEESLLVMPVLAWDYVTKPEYKAILSGSGGADVIDVSNRSNGRTGLGTIYRCERGSSISSDTIVDWEPFQQYTYEAPRSPGIRGRTTIQLTPIDGGTKVCILVGKGIGGTRVARTINDLVYRRLGASRIRRGIAELRAMISREITEGRVGQPIEVDLSQDELDIEIMESLVS